ncbi:hypothetical protein BVX98_03955 [bacterium F11]|nr:hypothetical protein BVX98_03955 [bacterium F11]
MADINLNQKLTVSPKVLQRTLLLGRVKMAQAIRMPEGEWAKLLCEVERDPLFRELLSAHSENKRIVRYRRYGRCGISGQFYEMQDTRVIGGTGQQPEALLAQKKHLLKLIEKVGQEKFEKHFLYRERGDSLENIANQCGIGIGEAEQLQDFILNMSVQAEFYHPSGLETDNIAKPTLVGRIVRNDDGSFSMSFFSPHLARGQYEINHEALKNWQKQRKLNRQSSSRIRKFIGVLELSNLKQGAFWRVMEYLLVLQQKYFETRDETKMSPVSLRKVARHVQFAPSTISRVMGNKSVLLPWDREILISDLMPGQRRVVLSILDKLLNSLKNTLTDAQLSKLVADQYGVRVSRRTITACRHYLANHTS